MRQRSAAHDRDANRCCTLLQIDAASPNDVDSLHDADFAFCGTDTFRFPCAPRTRRCLTGSFDSPDNPVIPTSAVLIRQRYAFKSTTKRLIDRVCFATRFATLIAARSASRRAGFLLRPTPAAISSAFTCAFCASA